MHGDLVVSVLDCQSLGPGFKSRLRQKIASRFLLYLHPLANAAMMSILTAHCPWEDETVRGRIGYSPSYAEAKKMKSLTLHTHDCSRASLRDCFSASSSEVHHSFIPAISIAPLQVPYYSEALPTTARILYRSFTPKRTGNCR